MASDEGDGEIIRELPATADSIKEPGMVKDYKVLVKTGNEFGSGTDANVFINIFGSKACFHFLLDTVSSKRGHRGHCVAMIPCTSSDLIILKPK